MTNLCFTLPRLKELRGQNKGKFAAYALKEFYQEAEVAVINNCLVRITEDQAGKNDFRILKEKTEVDNFFQELYHHII